MLVGTTVWVYIPPSFASPFIGLSRSISAPGTTITIDGSGFPPGASGPVWFDSNGNEGRDVGEPSQVVVADSAGSFQTTLTIPNVASGQNAFYDIWADIPAGGFLEAHAQFRVHAFVTATPSSGPPGTLVEVSSSDFPAGASVTVTFLGTSTPRPTVTVTAGANGAFKATLTVPLEPADSYEIAASIPSFTARTPFRVVEGITLGNTILPGGGSLSQIGTGWKGTIVSVSGSGFLPGASGNLWLDNNNNLILDAGEISQTVTIDSTTRFTTTLTVPSATEGFHWIVADVPSGGTWEANAQFTILPFMTTSPDRGPVGTTATISGSGFPAQASVNVWFDSNGNEALDAGEISQSLTTNALGDFAAILTAPEIESGGYRMFAMNVPSGTPKHSVLFIVDRQTIVNPRVGPVGTILTVSGSGYKMGASGVVWFETNNNGVLDQGEPSQTVSTGSTSSFTTTLTVPFTSVSVRTIRVDVPSGGLLDGEAFFAVASPVMTLNPDSAPAGASLSVHGVNLLGPGASGTVWFDVNHNNLLDAGDPSQAVTTDESGNFVWTLAVPNVDPGSYNIKADVPSGGVIELSDIFRVRGIALSFTSGPPGVSAGGFGHGFEPGASGRVWFDSNNNGVFDAGEPSQLVTAGSHGSIQEGKIPINLTVPSVPAASYNIIADVPSGGTAEASAQFAVTGFMTVNPGLGLPGTSVEASGSGFMAGGSGTVWFDSNGNGGLDAGEPSQSVTTSLAGTFTATLTVPVVPAGNHDIRADIPLGNPVEAARGFTVVGGISLNPSNGLAGNSVTVSGFSFASGASGNVWFDSNGNGVMDAGEPSQLVPASSSGTFTTSLIVPSVAESFYFIRADIPSGGATEASAVFRLRSEIRLSPASGPAGTVTTVIGTGFVAGASGNVWFDTNSNFIKDTSEPSQAITASSGGTFTTTLTIPAVSLGPYQVRADAPTGSLLEANTLFSVTVISSITLNPVSGPPGTIVTISGSGFVFGATGPVWFDSNSNSAFDAGEPSQSVFAGSTGAFTTTLTVPMVPNGLYKIRTGLSSGGVTEAGFTVASSAISLSPDSGRAGTVVTVSGSNFLPNTGNVWFDSNGNGSLDSGEPSQFLSVGTAGTFTATLTVPSLTQGTYNIRADIPSGGAVDASALFTLITDATPPTITIPSNMIVEATSSAGAVVNYAATVTDDTDPSPSLTCSPASGSTFPLGTNTVNCTAQDASHNTASASFTVTVQDTTPPTIDAHGDLTVEATSASGAVVNYSPPASHDAVGGDGTASCSPASGSTFALGDTTVNCTASDAAGNTATPTSFRVVVEDTTLPTLAVPADIIAEASGPSGAAVTYTASASDIVDGSITPACTPASGSAFPLGITNVNCDASDSHGNTVAASFHVTVQDTTPPALNLPPDITAEATSLSGASVPYSAGATDAVDGSLPASCSPASGSTFALGDVTVNCTATDARGNTVSGSFHVTVRDTTPPALTLPADITVEAAGPSGTAVEFTASGLDIVDGSVPVTCTPASGTTFPVGTTRVLCGAVDARGNDATGSFDVVARDTIPPTVRITGFSDGDSFIFGSVPAAPACEATDSVSGTVPCNMTGYSTAVGDHTLTATATDAAGNVGTATLVYRVLGWQVLGFYQPVDMGTPDNPVVNVIRSGASVPMKFEVFAGATQMIDMSDIQAFTQRQISCSMLTGDPADEIEITNTGGTSLRYDIDAGQFIANWKTPSGSAGTCHAVTVTAVDGSGITAYFRLK